MDSAELLAQLADIHQPPPVSFWPPAPGWWILTVVILGLAGFFGRRFYFLHKQRKTCNFALQELHKIYVAYQQAQGNSAQQDNDSILLYINQFNAVLRRVAMWHYPSSGAASLGGAAWVDFVRKKGDSSRLSDDIAEALSRGRFMTHYEIDADLLNEFGQQWISSLYLSKTQKNLEAAK